VLKRDRTTHANTQHKPKRLYTGQEIAHQEPLRRVHRVLWGRVNVAPLSPNLSDLLGDVPHLGLQGQLLVSLQVRLGRSFGRWFVL
jgi:hypothetical protein